MFARRIKQIWADFSVLVNVTRTVRYLDSSADTKYEIVRKPEEMLAASFVVFYEFKTN